MSCTENANKWGPASVDRIRVATRVREASAPPAAASGGFLGTGTSGTTEHLTQIRCDVSSCCMDMLWTWLLLGAQALDRSAALVEVPDVCVALPLAAAAVGVAARVHARTAPIPVSLLVASLGAGAIWLLAARMQLSHGAWSLLAAASALSVSIMARSTAVRPSAWGLGMFSTWVVMPIVGALTATDVMIAAGSFTLLASCSEVISRRYSQTWTAHA